MKIAFYSVLFLMICSTAWAGGYSAEIKNVLQDPIRGSIIVETDYLKDGAVVEKGRVRYLETSGTEAEIIQKAKDDAKIHCNTLMIRDYIVPQELEIQKTLTQPVIDSIKPNLIGYKTSGEAQSVDFKGKTISVSADGVTAVTVTK